MEEIWKTISEYENYKVSNFGRIKSLKYGRWGKEQIIIPVSNHRGYLKVSLCNKCGVRNKNIHRLVAEAFIPNPNNLPVVNHKDGNKLNNNFDNLEWCTHSQNSKHAFENHLVNTKGTPVLQFDKNGNFIKEYKSIIEASRIYKTNSMNIINCCKGRNKTAKGFIWKYKIKEEN